MEQGKIERLVASLGDSSRVDGMMRFFRTGPGEYGEGDVFLGVRMPEIRALVREIWSDCSLEDLEEAIQSPWHEARMCALLVLARIFSHARRDERLRSACVSFYLSHTDRINNWDLVDLSCTDILGAWYLDRDRTPLYRMAGSDRSLWERRMAVVSCLRFVREGQFEDALAISDMLLHDSHDLIHKAVGWILREVGKRDADLLREYLSTPLGTEAQPRCAVMPRTALRYSLEKFSDSERLRFMRYGKE